MESQTRKPDFRLFISINLTPELLAALAVRLARGGPVVLQPTQASRAFFAERLQHPAIFWFEDDRPEVDDLLGAVDSLLWMGPVTLLVQGPGALEDHAEDEAPDAVLRELVEECPEAVQLLVVVPEGTYLYRPAKVQLNAEDPRLRALLALAPQVPADPPPAAAADPARV